MSVMYIQWVTVHQDSHEYNFYIVNVYCDFVPEETKLAKIIFLFVWGILCQYKTISWMLKTISGSWVISGTMMASIPFRDRLDNPVACWVTLHEKMNAVSCDQREPRHFYAFVKVNSE